MNDWQYLSIGGLKQNEFFPKKIIIRDQNLKMKEIGELVADLLCLDKQIGISLRG